MEGRNDRTMNDRYSSTQKQESCVQHAINIFGFFIFIFIFIFSPRHSEGFSNGNCGYDYSYSRPGVGIFFLMHGGLGF